LAEVLVFDDLLVQQAQCVSRLHTLGQKLEDEGEGNGENQVLQSQYDYHLIVYGLEVHVLEEQADTFKQVHSDKAKL